MDKTELHKKNVGKSHNLCQGMVHQQFEKLESELVMTVDESELVMTDESELVMTVDESELVMTVDESEFTNISYYMYLYTVTE